MSSRPFDSLLKQSVTKLVNGLPFFFLFFFSFFCVWCDAENNSRASAVFQHNAACIFKKEKKVESVAHYKICMKCGSVQSSLEMQVIADWSTSYCFWIKGGHFLLLDAVITALS